MSFGSKFVFVASLFVLLLVLSGVSASDLNDTTTASNDVANTNSVDNVKEYSTHNMMDDKLSDGTPKTVVLNSTSFGEYVTNNSFNEKVSDGDTIDVQGLIYGNYNLSINKSLNFISSTGDGRFDSDSYVYHTTLRFFSGASGSNVTGITFDNTVVSIENVTDVKFDNIRCIDYWKNIGSGVGVFSIRNGSSNVNVTNSYFETTENGMHSTMVFAGVHDCLFENNTVIGVGQVGNLVYMTTYGTNYESEIGKYGNYNITIRNNVIDGSRVNPHISTCYNLAIEGINHTIENNLINSSNLAIQPQYGATTVIANILFRNNTVNKFASIGFANSTIIGNTFENLTTAGTYVYDNYIENLFVSGRNCVVENNTIRRNLTIMANDTLINNNIVSTSQEYSIMLRGNNIRITNNNLVSLRGRGVDTIRNLSEYYQENNTGTVFYLDDDNWETYFTKTIDRSYNYQDFILNPDIINQPELWNYTDTVYENDWSLRNDTIYYNDTLILDAKTPQTIRLSPLNVYYPLLMEINMDWSFPKPNDEIMTMLTNVTNITGLSFTIKDSNMLLNELNLCTDCTIINSTLPFTKIGRWYTFEDVSTLFTVYNLNLIDSMYKEIDMHSTFNQSINNSIMLSGYPINDTYILSSRIMIFNTSTGFYFVPAINTSTGLFLDTVNDNSKILVTEYYNESKIAEYPYNRSYPNIYVDRPLIFEGLLDYPFIGIGNEVYFVGGSYGSSVTNVVFDGKVYVNDSRISFVNCTFNDEVIISGVSRILFENCSFNGNKTILNISDSNNIDITNSLFNQTLVDNSTGDSIILLDNVNNLNLNNNTLYGDITAVNMTNSSNNNIHDNFVNVTGGYGVVGDNQSTGNVIVNNTLFAGDYCNYDSISISENNNYTIGRYDTYNTTISVNLNQNVSIDEYTSLTIRVISNLDNSSVDRGYVDVYVDGIFYKQLTLVNGSVTTDMFFNSIGNATLKVFYFSPNRFSDNNVSVNVSVVQGYVNLSVNNISAGIGDNLTFHVTVVPRGGGGTVNEGLILITIAGQTFNSRVINGSVNISTIVPHSWVEESTFRLLFNGTRNYARNLVTLPMNISKGNVNLTAPRVQAVINANTILTARVLTSSGENITEGNVSFTTSNGTLLSNVPVINGTATTNIVFNTSYIGNITVTYHESTYYKSNTTTLYVYSGKLNTTITVDSVRGLIGENVTLIARVVDSDGNNVTGGIVGFKINGITLRDANGTVITARLVNGVATITYTVPKLWLYPNTTIMATYGGNDYVNPSRSQNNTVQIDRLNCTIRIITPNIIGKTGDTVTIQVLIIDTNGRLISGEGQVVFKLNGITLRDSNNRVIYVNVSNGIATLTYTIPSYYAAYNYTLTAVYGGGVYNRATDTNNFTIEKTQTHIIINPIKTSTNKVTVTARIYDGNNRQVQRATMVTLKINGITYKNNITASNGLLNITLDFPYKVGVYDLLVIAGENSQYESSRLTTIIQRT